MINWSDDFFKDMSSLVPCFFLYYKLSLGSKFVTICWGSFQALLACSFFLGALQRGEGGGHPFTSVIRGFSSHTDGQHIDTVKTTFSTKRDAAQLESMRTRLPDLAVNWIYIRINLLKIYGELLLTGYRTGSGAISYLACEQLTEFWFKGRLTRDFPLQVFFHESVSPSILTEYPIGVISKF